MSRRQWRFFIEDIVDAIQKIQQYCGDMDVDTFCQDQKTLDAVQRRFILIGEAARHIPEHVTDKYDSVPWREMRDMRNFAVHVYWGVTPEVIWDTIQQDLPSLIDHLTVILEQEIEDS